MKGVVYYGETNMGRVRTNNEDAFVVQPIWDDNNLLAVVIDGVGGYEGGEVAAAIARDSIVEYLEKYYNGERLELLKQAVVYANNRIYEERLANSKLSNMGCVLTAILIDAEDNRVNLAHVGDTRLYQYAFGEIKKLSHDHSLVGYREEIGDLTEEEAMNHPQRNIISRDVGSKQLDGGEDYVDAESFPFEYKSSFLLCSDGLSDLVTSAAMKEVLEMDISVAEKVELLIERANEAGGKDNITVIIVESDREEPVLEDNGEAAAGQAETLCCESSNAPAAGPVLVCGETLGEALSGEAVLPKTEVLDDAFEGVEENASLNEGSSELPEPSASPEAASLQEDENEPAGENDSLPENEDAAIESTALPNEPILPKTSDEPVDERPEAAACAKGGKHGVLKLAFILIFGLLCGILVGIYIERSNEKPVAEKAELEKSIKSAVQETITNNLPVKELQQDKDSAISDSATTR